MKPTRSTYDHAACEQKMQTLWQEEKIYHPTRQSTKPLYTVDTPPPTVSGNLHIGHIFSYTQTDCMVRYQRLRGFQVFYPFGFDDNGLATERFVEKKRSISPYQVGRSSFIAACLEEVEQAAQEFTALWKRMGISAYWEKTYSTIDNTSRALSQESFIRLYKQGHIYRKKEPALYCTVCRTSVAQAELDDHETDAFFYKIVFKDRYGSDLFIETTRPELLSSCVALFYHPEDARYKHLAGQEAIVPLFDHVVPIYADSRVLPEKGTGLVMCCTFGDSTDVAWYKDFNLRYIPSIGSDGIWLAHTGVMAGKKRKDARLAIIDALKKKNIILAQTPIKHAVNTHERCKNDIEYLLLDQWFLNILEHKKKFLELADQIEWFPAFMKTRYIDWVEHIAWDWCLSRQRYYGIPFPAWHCNQCNTVILASLEQLPVDPQELSAPTVCTQCTSTDLRADTDVMDTWNTSSLTPYIAEKLYHTIAQNPSHNPFETDKTTIPMSMRPQAHDIIRTWAFYTIVKSWFHHGTIPWKHIVISGHVTSDSKEKLSKSKEQKAIAPLALLEKHAADAIRYWTCAATLGYDTVFSDTQIKNGERLITKLWNAFHFLRDHKEISSGKPVGRINEWIMHHISRAFITYDQSLSRYDGSAALNTIERFFWHTFCDNYLELIKNQLFNPDKYDQHIVASTRATLYAVGLRILQMYAPFIPHITELIYQEQYRATEKIASLHLTSFDDIQKNFSHETAAQIIDYIVIVSSAVRKLKTEQQLSLKTVLKELLIHVPTHLLASLKEEEQLLQGITQAEAIIYTEEKSINSLTNKDGQWYAQVTIV